MAAIVQSSATNQGSAVTSITLTLSGVTAGNALVIEGAFSPLSATDSVVYPTGWTSAVSAKTPGGNSYAVLGVITGVASGTQTITISSKLGSSTYWAIRMHEVSGLASSPVDSAAIATGTTTGTTLAITSPAATTGASIAFSPLAYDNANTFSGVLSASSPWTTLWYVGNASIEAGAGADQVYTGASTPTITWSGMTADTAGWAAAIVPLLAASSGDTGSSATTDGADLSAASATLSIAASSAKTDGADVSLAVSSLHTSGSGAPLDGADVSSAAAVLNNHASSAKTDGADTSVATGSLSATGISSTTDGQDSSATASAMSVAGAGSSVDVADISNASGTVGTATITGSTAVTDGADASASTVTLSMSGSSTTTDGADSSAAVGVMTVTATSATADGPDASALLSLLLITSTGYARDGPDVSLALSGMNAVGSSATTDGPDISQGTATEGAVPFYVPSIEFNVKSNQRSFYAALISRIFYAALSARAFYAALISRSFYAASFSRSFYRMNNTMIPAFPNAIDPAETKVLTIDATADLATGVTLTGIIGSPIITLLSGNDPLASTRFSGAIINSASIPALPPGIPVSIVANMAVQIIATTPMDGATYEIRVPCTTSQANNTITLKGVLNCTSI